MENSFCIRIEYFQKAKARIGDTNMKHLCYLKELEVKQINLMGSLSCN